MRVTQRERGVVSAASDLLLRSSFNFFAFNLDDDDDDDARPAPTPGEMAAPGRPGPENFQERPAPPHPENAPGLTVTLLRPKDFPPCPAPPRKFYIK